MTPVFTKKKKNWGYLQHMRNEVKINAVIGEVVP